MKVSHGEVIKPLACCSLIIWNRVLAILSGLPVLSLHQKLIILCWTIHFNVVRPSSPSAMQLAVLVFSLSIYFQK